MIQQIALPYIRLNSVPKFVNKIINNKCENTTESYIKNLQTTPILEKLKENDENEIINEILLSICQNDKYNYNWILFEYLEIFHNNYSENNGYIKDIMCFGKNNNEIIYSLKKVLNSEKLNIKTNSNSNIMNEVNNMEIIAKQSKLDLFVFDVSAHHVLETGMNEIEIFLLYLPVMLLKLKLGGNIVISIQDTYSVLIHDIIFYLNSIFEKVYVGRPNIMITSDNHRYIICKTLERKLELNEIGNLLKFFYYLIVVLNKDKILNKSIRIFEQDIPMFFKCKIDEINCIYGQQILEYTMMVINNKQHELYSYYKTRNDKIDNWIKNHKQYLNANIEQIYKDQESKLAVKQIVNTLVEKIENNSNTIFIQNQLEKKVTESSL